MKVTTKDVEYIAQLSRLTIPEGEMEKFTEQFNQILNYADILQQIDTAGIEPDSVRAAHQQRVPRRRSSARRHSGRSIENAPAVHNGGFKVPRVIE